MGVWEFVVVYLAAFVLVQLAIYRYLRGRGDGNARMAVAGPPSADRGPSADHGRGDDHERHERRASVEPIERRRGDDPVRRCPSCGAENELDGPYTFCRNCASRLPG